MISKNLIIYENNTLFEILNEIKHLLSFKLTNVSNDDLLNMNFNQQENYLLLSKKKINHIDNQIIIGESPLKIEKLLQLINVNFLKIRFNVQSKINIGSYILDLNSRIISSSKGKLNLTEREIDIIMFLNNSKKSITVNELQKDVWGHISKLETHTVETHIYRLRKKIKDKFKDENFIVSSKNGYLIN
tara:strand:+ start:215 stop:778 length:564 start_codon:yes stop_codon:yes gene_type:complete